MRHRSSGRRSIRGRAARPIALMIALAASALLAAACVGEPPEVTNGDPELVAGRSVYGARCASCHGADGGGGAGGRLAGDALIEAYPDIEAQIDLVTNGRGQMPAFMGRLDEDQIRAVVRYTREIL